MYEKIEPSKRVTVQMCKPLVSLLLVLVVSYVLYHSLAGDTLFAYNPYDSYSLQAENWLAGNLHIAQGEYYTWLELAIYDGQYYLSFPPVPSVLMLPWVAVLGSAAAVPSNVIAAMVALCAVAGVYLLFLRFGVSVQLALFWALLSTVGSNFYWLSTSGGVWFFAQICHFCFIAWGLYAATYRTTAGNTIAACFLALAVGCRPFSIAVLALFFLSIWWGRVCKTRNPLRWGIDFWVPFFAALAIGVAMGVYNVVRFDSFVEFGHTYLPEFMRVEEGQFHLSYFWPNVKGLFSPVSFNSHAGLMFSIMNGFCPFIANPIFFYGGCVLVRRAWQKKITLQEMLCCAVALAALAFLCCHKTMGGWQFGARYTVDLIPYLWLCAWMWYQTPQNTSELAEPEHRTLGCYAWTLCACACAFNIYGALYMLQH